MENERGKFAWTRTVFVSSKYPTRFKLHRKRTFTRGQMKLNLGVPYILTLGERKREVDPIPTPMATCVKRVFMHIFRARALTCQATHVSENAFSACSQTAACTCALPDDKQQKYTRATPSTPLENLVTLQVFLTSGKTWTNLGALEDRTTHAMYGVCAACISAVQLIGIFPTVGGQSGINSLRGRPLKNPAP